MFCCVSQFWKFARFFGSSDAFKNPVCVHVLKFCLSSSGSGRGQEGGECSVVTKSFLIPGHGPGVELNRQEGMGGAIHKIMSLKNVLLNTFKMLHILVRK